MTGENTAISADLSSSSAERFSPRAPKVVYRPMSMWVIPIPQSPDDRAAGMTEGSPSPALQSTFWSPAHIRVV